MSGLGRGLGHLLAVVLVVALAPSPGAAERLVSHDTFGGGFIDPDRWRGFHHVVGWGRLGNLPPGAWPDAVDDQRLTRPKGSTIAGNGRARVLDSELQLALTAHGGSAAPDDAFPGRAVLGFRPAELNWEAVRRLRARITLVTADAPPCPDGTESRVRAQLVFGFRGEGTELLFVTLSLERWTSDDRIVAVLNRCLDEECTVAQDLDWVVFEQRWCPVFPTC